MAVAKLRLLMLEKLITSTVSDQHAILSKRCRSAITYGFCPYS